MPEYSIKNLEVACHGSGSKMPNCFWNCVNLENVTAVSWGGYWGSFAFNTCQNLRHCNAQASYGFSFCNNVEECYASAPNGGATSRAIDRSYGVRYCQVGPGCSYAESYSSPTAITGYECASTLEGGWNTVS